MQIIFSSQTYSSFEHLYLSPHEAHSTITSPIFTIHNHIKTNHHGQTTFISIQTQLNNTKTTKTLESDGNGNWTENNEPIQAFNGCIDIDISLTPFTNTLPINRLKLAEQAQQTITVLYFDILEQQIKPVQQRYIRLSQNTYKFENVPNDFEAVIEVDEDGLVVNYPGLFTRLAK